MPYKDPAQRRARDVRYAAEHRAEIRAKKAAYAAEHAEHIAAYQAAYRAAHREEQHAREKARYAANREEDNARCAARHAANREEDNARAAVYDAGHREPIRARKAARYLENREAVCAERRAWRQAHPEEARAYASTSRARRSGAGTADLSAGQWREIQAAYGFRCAYCPPDCEECKTRSHALTRDHLTPVTKGGAHTLANIVPACASCNSRKHDGPPLSPVQPMLLSLAPAKQKRRR